MTDIKFFWSKTPGNFVNKLTGETVEVNITGHGPVFTGAFAEWCETLVETIIDASNNVVRTHGVTPTTLLTSRSAHELLKNSCLYSATRDFVPTLTRFKVYEDQIGELMDDEIQLVMIGDDQGHRAIVKIVS